MSNLISFSGFLAKYNIELQEYRQSGLRWRELEAVYADYGPRGRGLQIVADSVASLLQLCPSIHAVSSRVKDAEHVIEKIVRKSINNRRPWANVQNYYGKLTDCVGARALILFNEEWNEVHEYIRKTWRLSRGDSVAIVRGDDPPWWTQLYIDAGCRVETRDTGYRSVHYQLSVPMANMTYAVELQVRTLFEEARSEIDHRLRYPYYLKDVLLGDYIRILSALTGQSEEMASAARDLRRFKDLANATTRADKNERERWRESCKERVVRLRTISPLVAA